MRRQRINLVNIALHEAFSDVLRGWAGKSDACDNLNWYSQRYCNGLCNTLMDRHRGPDLIRLLDQSL